MKKIVFALETGALIAYGLLCAVSGIIGTGDVPVWLTVAFFIGAGICALCLLAEHIDTKEQREDHTKELDREFRMFDLREDDQ